MNFKTSPHYFLYNCSWENWASSTVHNNIAMILIDPPYGTTQSKWDTCFDLSKMWEMIHHKCDDKVPIVVFGTEPFSSALRLSNLKNYKYDWVWNKRKTTGFLNAKKRPLVQHELISVFYKKQPTYNPIFHKNKLKREFKRESVDDKTTVYGKQKKHKKNIEKDVSYPRSIIEQTGVVGNSKDKVDHPNQKPVSLLEYLIKTYTHPGDIVLDFCMGSGSSGVAAIKSERKFIGVETESKYFEIASKRIDTAIWGEE